MDLRTGVTYDLNLGSKGARVESLQRWLTKHGYFTDEFGIDIPIDGNFGPKTKLAVLWAQKESGLKEDGIVGPLTQTMMASREYSTDTEPSPEYKKERYNPDLPLCVGVSLVFNGRNLTLRYGSKSLRYMAVSGVPTNNVFDYSQKQQKKQDIGPIPEGRYWIRPDELWTNGWYRPRSKRGWGNFAISIHPFVSTTAFVRGGFFIHGGAVPGSKGCIDLTLSMDRFVCDLLHVIGNTPKCQVPLLVKYGNIW